MGKKVVSVLLCIALIVAAVCAVVFKKDANAKAADLTAAQADLATVKTSLETATADLTTAKTDLETAQADLAAAQAESARLQNAYDLQKSYVAKLEKRATDLLEAQAKIDVLTAQLAAQEPAEE